MKHHNKNGKRSIVEELLGDVVADVGLDYLHLVCIGVQKKLATIWVSDPFDNVRLSKEVVQKISIFRISIAKYVTSDFVRKPRAMKDLPRWKATELRLDLVYIGPVVYKDFLSPNCYDHFILLHVAIRLLLQKTTCRDHAPYADKLLRLFVKVGPKLYGAKFVSFNVHSLIHLAKDVERHGALDDFSAFPFENKLQLLINMLKQSGRPLQQIVRRLDEENRVNTNRVTFDVAVASTSNLRLEGLHTYGPLFTFISPVQQFRKLKCKNSCLTNHSPDNCVFIGTTHKIVFLIENFVLDNEQNIHVVGKRYKTYGDLFKKPIPSSHPLLLEFVVSDLADTLESFPFQLVQLKGMRIPMSNPENGKFVVSPILNLDLN